MDKIMINIKVCVLIFCYAYFFAHSNCSAQPTKKNHKASIQSIEGNWFDKKIKDIYPSIMNRDRIILPLTIGMTSAGVENQ